MSHPPPRSPSSAGNEINLVIDSAGHGTFHIATKNNAANATEKTATKPFASSKKNQPQTHLTFDIQIDESSQRYLIHTSMGRLDKIRDIHPGMNILRTLSYWNGLQKKRYGNNPTEVVKGGQLGIVAGKNARTNLVMMTLMGEYSHRAWEYDEVFQRELERFVEDALQFHQCLNGDGTKNNNDGGGDESGMTGLMKKAMSKQGSFYIAGPNANRTPGNNKSNKESEKDVQQGGNAGNNDGIETPNSGKHRPAEECPTPNTPATTSSSGKKGSRSNLLGKVLQKVIS